MREHIKKILLVMGVVVIVVIIGAYFTEKNVPIVNAIQKEATSTLNSKTDLIQTSLTVGDKIYNGEIKNGSSAYDLMNNLQSQGFVFTSKYYDGLGYFIDSIQDTKQDISKGLYWTFYVNNKLSNLGVSNYIIKNGDKITWKLESATNTL